MAVSIRRAAPGRRLPTRSVPHDRASVTGVRTGNVVRPFFTMIEPNINSAIKKGFFQQVRFLIQFGADINEKDELKRTPLINCVLVEDEKWGIGLARLLIEKGAAIGYRDTRGLNALHYACIYEREELMKIYLSAVDFNLSQTDRAGNTPLHYAVGSGSVVMTQRLIEMLDRYKLNGDIPNKLGVTPLIHAYKCGQFACAETLKSGGHGDEDVKDKVEFKTAKEWEREALTKMEAHGEQGGDGVKGEPRETCDSKHVVVRLTSATRGRSLSSSRPGSGSRTRMASGGEDEEVDVFKLPNRNTLSDRLYRSASRNESRNKAELVFKINPIECILKGAQNHPNVNNKVGAIERPLSANDVREDRVPTSWRCEMEKLFGSFEFQFTPSYVTSVKPRDPEQTTSEDTSSLRPPSPPATESLSGSMSDIGSVCSRRSTVLSHRRLSTVRPGEAKDRRRSTAASLSSKRRVLQSLLTLRGDHDTAGSDSSGASQTNRRRTKADTEVCDGPRRSARNKSGNQPELDISPTTPTGRSPKDKSFSPADVN